MAGACGERKAGGRGRSGRVFSFCSRMPRPFVRYTPALARRICALVAQGHTRLSLSEEPGMPCQDSIRRWRAARPQFERMWRGACARRTSVLRRLKSSAGGPRARVAAYSEAWADAICERLMDGCSLIAISRDPGMPSYATIHRWLNAYPEFRIRYALACDDRAHALGEEAIRIADEALGAGWPEGASAAEALALARARIATRLARAGRQAPRKHGLGE